MNAVPWMQKSLEKIAPYSGKMKEPFRMDEYVCMTDGHFIAAVKSPEVVRENPFDHSPSLERALTCPLGAEEFDLAHLQAWSNRNKPACAKCNGSREQTCTECHGTGVHDCICPDCDHEHEAECSECDNGKQVCECAARTAIPASVHGRAVDLVLLFQAIEHLSGAYRLGNGDAADRLTIGNDNWRVCVMNTRSDAVETYEPRALNLAGGACD